MTTSINHDNETELKALLNSIASQDETAFEQFYHRFESRLYRFIQTKLPDPFEAADILNEVFLDVWKQADRYKGQSKVSTWLFSIAHYKTIDKLRKKRPEQISDDKLNHVTDTSPDSISHLIDAQNNKDIHYCLETLKPAHRSVMELTFFEEMSYKDIAIVVDCPENTVKTRMFHAKQAMKRCLTRLFKLAGS